MPKKALTKRYIDTAKYEKSNNKQDIRWDKKLPSFGLRVFPSNSKSFVIFYRSKGRRRIMTLGRYGILTLEQARDLAKKELARVIDKIDPLGEKQKEARGESIEDLCSSYIVDYAKVHKKTWEKDERRLERHIIPIWGALKIKEVPRMEVKELHRKIRKESGLYEANRTLEILSKMFNFAIDEEFVEANWANPAKKIKKFKEEKRDRWVSQEELPLLAQAIQQEENLFARFAIWLYLLLGVRKSELLKAKWDDVDFIRKEIMLPDTKSGKTLYLPLSQAALTILKKLPRIEDNPFILPGHNKGQHLVNIDKPWQRIRKRAGIPDVRLHDLRRTLGSWLASAGNSLHLIGKVLGHSNQSTTAVYARFGQDQVRRALEDHGKKLIGIAGKKDITKVVNIKRAKRNK